MDARIYWIWMQQALGAGSPQATPLLRLYGSALAVYETPEEELRRDGLSQALCKRLADKDLSAAKEHLIKTLQMGGWVLTPEDAHFPSQLRGIHTLPLALYGCGVMPDMEHTPSVTVVGTRDCTAYGAQMASRLAAGLVAGGLCIVSGGAMGIDAAALRTALEQDGTTVCVQGCGLDIHYPAGNEDMRREVLRRGALLSEYPPGTPGRKQNFPVRNRLLAGLTHGTCVVEAPAVSGALITARYALEQGRDVFAVPGTALMPNMAGCNRLIRDGAHLIGSAVDILEEFRPRFGEQLHFEAARQAEQRMSRERSNAPALKVADSAPPSKAAKRSTKKTAEQVLSAEEAPVAAPPQPTPCPDYVSETARRIYGQLTETPQPIDELAAVLSLPVHQALAALTELEIAGCVSNSAGGQYRRK